MVWRSMKVCCRKSAKKGVDSLEDGFSDVGVPRF